MRETAREVAEKIVWAWSADDESYYQSDLIDRVAAVLTAERAARERAERERDTLRQHTAVLRAECQAGRLRYPKVEHSRACESTRYVMGEDWYCHCGEGELITARQQTDAAGAMGDTEVGRG